MSNRRDPIQNTYGSRVIGIPLATVIAGMMDIGPDHPTREQGGLRRTTTGSNSLLVTGKGTAGGWSMTIAGIATETEITASMTMSVMTTAIETIIRFKTPTREWSWPLRMQRGPTAQHTSPGNRFQFSNDLV